MFADPLDAVPLDIGKLVVLYEVALLIETKAVEFEVGTFDFELALLENLPFVVV